MEWNRRKSLICFFGSTLFISTVLWAADRVIYDDDNRLDWHEVTNPDHLEWAKSTAILVQTSSIQTQPDNTVRLPTTTLQQAVGVCDDEPYAQQPKPGFCSGFLVAEDIFVTAGHCITSKQRCNTTSFVFGYGVSQPGSNPDIVSQDNVYRCAQIVKQVLNNSNQDFAVIRLDRKVQGIKPLKYRTSGKIADGEDLVLIGHPVGLPSKVADGANVRDNSNPIYFVANTDSYQGNSGSAVFNANTGEVEGILVRGEDDFVPDPRRGCEISNRCTGNGCRGEDVSRASEFVPHIPAPPPPPPEPVDIVVEINPAIEIPDADLTGINIPLEMKEKGEAFKVALELDIKHTYVGDLNISLTSPKGTSVLLRSREGTHQDNLQLTYEIGAMVEEEIQGDWILNVSDGANSDTGIVERVKLIVTILVPVKP